MHDDAKKAAPRFATREDWLREAAQQWRPLFKQLGKPLPDKLRIGVGWMATGVRSKAIGQAWHDDASKDGTREVTISLKLDDPVAVLATLRHELCHTALPKGTAHKRPFKVLAEAVGLEGPAKATFAGPALRKELVALVKVLGPYPHAAMDPFTEKKKQTTRMLKAECEECGMLFRVSAKHAGDVARCPSGTHGKQPGNVIITGQDGEPWEPSEDEEDDE